MNNPVTVIPPRVPFLDPRTGDISRAWYLLILALVNRVGGEEGLGTDDLAIGTLIGNMSSNLDAMVGRLDVALGSLPTDTPIVFDQLSIAPSAEYRQDDNPAPTLIGDYRQDDVSPVVWVGTLGQQNADRVAITGGTLDGTAIGATTASTGKFTTVTSNGGASFMTTSAALTNGAAAAAATILNAPVAGNPTKWIGINDNGTLRYIPAW